MISEFMVLRTNKLITKQQLSIFIKKYPEFIYSMINDKKKINEPFKHIFQFFSLFTKLGFLIRLFLFKLQTNSIDIKNYNNTLYN